MSALIEQIGNILANDPVCNGRVTGGSIERLAALSSASRDDVLEEAALKAEAVSVYGNHHIAAAIRDMKSAPGEQSG